MRSEKRRSCLPDSLKPLEVPIGPAHDQNARILDPAEEKMTLSARPIRFSNGTNPTPPTFLREPPPSWELSPIIPDEEIVIVRNMVDGRIVRITVTDIENRVTDPVGKGFLIEILFANGAVDTRDFLAPGQVADRTLRRPQFLENAIRLQVKFDIIDDQSPVGHPDLVSGHPDQPLDEIPAIDRMLEDDDVPGLRFVAENSPVEVSSEPAQVEAAEIGA